MSAKRLLGVVASCRKIGNGEIVVKSVAERLAPQWELSLVRLPELHIAPCKGCYNCLLPGKECKIVDDVVWLLDRFRESDGIIFSSPNYLLGPVGSVKMLTDRAFQASKYFDLFQQKRVAVALTLGSEEYRGYSDTVLASQVGSLGLKIVGLECFYGRQPGGCAMANDFHEKIDCLTRCFDERGLAEPFQPNRCPYCRSDLFRVRDGGLECAICKSSARLKANGLKFASQHSEFTRKGQRRHIEKLISEKEGFESIKVQLNEIRVHYQGGNWLTPRV
jgi:multimeric flavodoxin WrbA